jgi:polyisoprenoid-binding protein YceI
MIRNAAKLAMATALAAAAATLSFGQTGSWLIDSAHSTASLSLVSSSDATQPFNIAITMLAGAMILDESDTSQSSLRLSIYPADQDSSLLNPDGSFRNGGLAALARYTLMTFRSRKVVVIGRQKIEFTGDLTVVHVRREAADAWSNSYAGAVSSEPVVNTVTREVIFVANLSGLPAAPGQANRRAEIKALATVQRDNFKGLLAVLRDSNWPPVVLDEECRMPYYIGPSMKGYTGATCTGTPVERTLDTEPPYYLAADNVGAGIPVPPAGDEVTILAHLLLRQAVSKVSGSAHK